MQDIDREMRWNNPKGKEMKCLRYMTVLPLLLIMVSIASGLRCYDQAKADMVEDLNQALQRTAMVDSRMEDMLDSLSSIHGNPMLTFDGSYKGFSQFLRIPSLRDTAHVSYSLTETKGNGVPQARIYSDAITVAGCADDGSAMMMEVRAYANPTMVSMLGHAGMVWPIVSFFTGIMLLLFMFMSNRLLCTSVCCASDVNGLVLTPMQEQLMSMFMASPTRTLSKDEICSALWPKKDNPEDTLYTFISRMKSALIRQSSFRIENKRGKEYVLTDEMGN